MATEEKAPKKEKAPSKASGKAPKKEKAPAVDKPKRETQNGVPRPGKGTTTGKVWDISDALTKKRSGKPALRKDVLAACEDEKINPATAATQYGRWRKFNGHQGRGTEE